MIGKLSGTTIASVVEVFLAIAGTVAFTDLLRLRLKPHMLP